MAKSRAWVFTLNNYTSEEVEEIKAWICYYLIFGKEVAPTTGTPHLQGYVYFEHAKTLATLKKKFQARARWEAAQGTPKQASDYCSKDGDVFEKGTRPLSSKEKGDKGKRKFEEAFAAYKEKRYEDMGKFGLQMKQFDQLQAKIDQRDQKLEELTECTNEWHYGVPGCGKSHIRYEYPEVYIKKTNKWWNNYKNQDVVVIEEFSKFKIELTDDLKEWAGEHPFAAETKGGQIEIRPKKTIVTSQQHPADIWTGDDLAAMMRRFKVYRWTEPYYIGARPENGRNPRWYDPRVSAPPDPPSPNRFTSLPIRFQ